MTKTIFLIFLWAWFSLGAAPGWCGETEPAPGQQERAVEPASFGERLAEKLQRAGLSREFVVVIVSALPVVELRGAIPIGYNIFKLNPWLVYLLAVVGNMVPVPFILLLLKPASQLLMRFKLGRLFFDWLFARARRKSAEIEKYETLGLAIFVAIPLPVTGAWTGAAAAFVMGLSFKHSLFSILLGVLIAGVIMTIVSLMGWWGALIAGAVLLSTTVAAMMPWLKGGRRGPSAG